MAAGPVLAFGELLRRYRVAAGLSQETLAERAGISARAISDLERDAQRTPRRDTMGLLAEALGLSAGERATLEQAARRTRPAPALPAHAERPSNLPAQPTPLVGRAREVATACGLLRRADVRLLTLTGPGGVGKTHLGLQVAENLQDTVPDGVFFVALAPLRNPQLVAAAIAQALGLREGDAPTLEESLKGYLRDKQVLLLLDNFEHLLAAAPLVVDLLRTCRRLKVLATSRAALHVRGEQGYAVPPLAVPDPRHLPSLEALVRYDAVQLFRERAQQVRVDFALTPANAPAVAEICAHLDGLPLAIELAAAHIRLLPPRVLLARLSSRLQLLTGGARDVPERQQTLRATLDWSYELLAAGEQALFRRLAVFAGGCTLEAAEAVCNADGALETEVLQGVASLVDQSLLQQVEQADGEPRLGMLETMREYALERLEASREAATMQRRHALYYLALTQEVEPELTGPEQGVWLARLERERDNLRAALEWARESGAVELGLQLAAALWRFWYMHGHLSEGRGWLESLLARAGDGAAPASVRAKALRGAGVLAYNQGDYAGAMALSTDSLALYRELGDKQGCAVALNILANAAANQGDYERAVTLSEESLAQHREHGDKRGSAVALNNLGTMVLAQGDYGRAAALLEDSLTLNRELGDKRGIAIALMNLGEVAGYQRDYGRAAALYEDSLALTRELGDKVGSGHVLHNRGDVAREQGDYEHAVALYTQSLALYRALDDKVGMATCLEGMARAACAQGQLERAARFYGATAALRDAIRAPLSPVDRTAHDRAVAAVRTALGDDAFAAAWAAGQMAALETVIDEAMAETQTCAGRAASAL